MNTYEIISFTQANDAERNLLIAVEAAAREVASFKIRNQRMTHGYDLELEAAKALNLEGVRPAFLNTQMELYFLHAEIDHAQSTYARFCDLAANIIFGAALVFAEEGATA